jgi:TRAP-type C4-dicarboxylate transport system permease small subunit
MLTKILNVYAKLLAQLIIVLMVALIIAVSLQILGRYVPFIPRYLWTEEVARFSLIWIIFLGSMLGVREGKHFYVDFLPQNMPRSAEIALRILYYIFMYIVTLIFILFGYRYLKMGMIQESEITGMNLGFIYISVPVSGITWFIFLAEDLYKEFFLPQKREEHL